MRTRSTVVLSEETTKPERTDKLEDRGRDPDAEEGDRASNNAASDSAQKAMSPEPTATKSSSGDDKTVDEEKKAPTEIPHIYIEEATKENSRSPESEHESQEENSNEQADCGETRQDADGSDCDETTTEESDLVASEPARKHDSKPSGELGSNASTAKESEEERQYRKKQEKSRMQKSSQEKENEREIAVAPLGRNPLTSAFPFPAFPPNPSALLGGHMQSEFAKSLSTQFYNSLSLLASQAMMNVKQEPSETNYQGYDAVRREASSTDRHLPLPPRTASRSSDMSARSYDAAFSSKESASRRSPEYSPAHSGGSDSLLHRPPSGLSPKSLAEQLRNNDSASMVVSRQQKFSGRGSSGYKPAYSMSGSESPPPWFPGLPTSAPDAYTSGGDLPVSSSGNTTSSPSLHHFTTRYTVETPADPSRLGVELVLDHDNDEPVIEVECGGNRGLLYVNKLCQGSKGQSIHFNDEWLTPNEFQFISGRETAKDWKRSIRHCGKSLKTLMTKGILQVHPPVCECNQCRGLHTGSKLLAGNKIQQKEGGSIKKSRNSPPPYLSEGNLDANDMMTKHGYEGGLSSIISQLHKANGFDTALESSETLDLTTKSHAREESGSPDARSRKRPHNDSPTDHGKTPDSIENGHTSPEPKRPYPRKGEYSQHDSQGPFPPSYAFASQEDQYRRMLALLNRSASPEEQQRMYNLAADTLHMHPRSLADYAALHNPLQLEAFYERSKRKYAEKNGRASEQDGHTNSSLAYDLTRKSRQKSSDNPVRKSEYGFPYGPGKLSGSKSDKYRKHDRAATPSSPADNRRYHRPTHAGADSQKYIALEGRSRDQDPRSWSNKTPDANRQDLSMIDLNSSGSSLAGQITDWYRKHPGWSAERDNGGRKQSEWRNNDTKASPGRRSNGSFPSYYPDSHIILDRIPISKNPVTTLHHRPPAKYSGSSDTPYPPGTRQPYTSPKDAHRHQSRSHNGGIERGDPHRAPSAGKSAKRERMPMLDLQKHAVPMMSLTYSKRDGEAYRNARDGGPRVRLSNTSDESIKEEATESSPRRESSSAPPPQLSPQAADKIRRPTSAQDGTERRSLFGKRRRPSSPFSSQRVRGGHTLPDAPVTSSMTPSPNAAEGNLFFRYEDFFKRRRDEIQGAFEDMNTWSVDDVTEFVRKIDPTFDEHLEDFRKLQIDGEGLPLLTERHLMDTMNVKLGQALKLVARVRRTLKIYPDSLACSHHPFTPLESAPSQKKAKLADDTQEQENDRGGPENGNEVESGEGELKIDENNNDA